MREQNGPSRAAGHTEGVPDSPRVSGTYKQAYAYDHLKNAIISGVFPPEKLLVERELCEMLGISRTPVREALRRLSSEGLAESHPGRGVFVTRLTASDALELYELKEALERMAVRLCIQRMSGGDLAVLARCLEDHAQAYQAGSAGLAADQDLQFHTLLVEFARSPRIEEQAKAILVQTRRLSQLSVYDTSHTQSFIQEHRAIYDAIEAGDPAGAEAAVSRHIAAIAAFQTARLRMFL